MTQTDLLLDWLLEGHTITPLEARFPPFNCLALSQRLRTAARAEYDGINWPILSEPFHTDSGKVVAKYRMVGIPPIAHG